MLLNFAHEGGRGLIPIQIMLNGIGIMVNLYGVVAILFSPLILMVLYILGSSGGGQDVEVPIPTQFAALVSRKRQAAHLSQL